jgi:hypothetical protein
MIDGIYSRSHNWGSFNFLTNKDVFCALDYMLNLFLKSFYCRVSN